MKAPAHEQAPIWRETLERALAAVGPADDELRRGIDETLGLMNRLETVPLADPVHMELLDSALQRLDICIRAAGADETALDLSRVESAVRRCRDATLDGVVAHQKSVPPPRPSTPSPALPLRASVGVPSLHRLERDFIAPAVPDAPIDIDAHLDALERDEEPLLRASVAPRALAPGATHLRSLARDLAENLGAMGMLRQVRKRVRRDPAVAAFDQRLLSSLDALVALGRGALPGRDRIDVLEALLAWSRDPPGVDPVRAFASTFVLACVDGADTVRSAVGELRHAHPSTVDLRADALALGSNPEIGPAMSRLLHEEDVVLMRVALEVHTRRVEVDFGATVMVLAHPDSRVRAEAARALARARQHDAAIDALQHALADERELSAALAMVESLLVLDHRPALGWLRERAEARALDGRLEPDEREKLRLLAVAGAHRDADILAAWCSPDPGYAELIGWFGAPRAVEPLLSLCDARPTDRTLRRAVARAIGRIAGGREPADVPTAAELRARWAEQGSGLDPDIKHRFGRPFSVASCLDELEREARPEDRDACAFELAMMTAGMVRIEPRDWVARQRQAIATARSLDAERRFRLLHRPGEWLGERLGKRRAPPDD